MTLNLNGTYDSRKLITGRAFKTSYSSELLERRCLPLLLVRVGAFPGRLQTRRVLDGSWCPAGINEG